MKKSTQEVERQSCNPEITNFLLLSFASCSLDIVSSRAGKTLWSPLSFTFYYYIILLFLQPSLPLIVVFSDFLRMRYHLRIMTVNGKRLQNQNERCFAGNESPETAQIQSRSHRLKTRKTPETRLMETDWTRESPFPQMKLTSTRRGEIFFARKRAVNSSRTVLAKSDRGNQGRKLRLEEGMYLEEGLALPLGSQSQHTMWVKGKHTHTHRSADRTHLNKINDTEKLEKMNKNCRKYRFHFEMCVYFVWSPLFFVNQREMLWQESRGQNHNYCLQTCQPLVKNMGKKEHQPW